MKERGHILEARPGAWTPFDAFCLAMASCCLAVPQSFEVYPCRLRRATSQCFFDFNFFWCFHLLSLVAVSDCFGIYLPECPRTLGCKNNYPSHAKAHPTHFYPLWPWSNLIHLSLRWTSLECGIEPMFKRSEAWSRSMSESQQWTLSQLKQFWLHLLTTEYTKHSTCKNGSLIEYFQCLQYGWLLSDNFAPRE